MSQNRTIGTQVNTEADDKLDLITVTGSVNLDTINAAASVLPTTVSPLSGLRANAAGTSVDYLAKIQTLADGATINWDLESGYSAKVTLGGNRTLAAPTNMQEGDTLILHVVQDGTGSRTLAYNSVYKFSGGTAPTLTTTANAVDLLSFSAVNTSGTIDLLGSSLLNFS